MKYIYILFIIILFFSCKNGETDLMQADKYHIEHAFLSNVEAVRLLMSYHHDGFNHENIYSNIPDSLPKYDHQGYLRYATYRDKLNIDRARTSPVCEWLDINVEDISYSKDSLKCVALCTILDRYNTSTEYECGYDGIAIAGLRNHKNEPFKIYFMPWLELLDCRDTRNFVAKLLEHYYKKTIKGHSLVASHGPYNYGINNPQFFETAVDFMLIDSLGLYWVETLQSGSQRVPTFYYSNQDSTITKYFCQ